MNKAIEKAANNGNVYAMLSVAYLYHHGVEVDPDPETAITWYKRSAAQGCARAKWELAKLYRDGEIVEPNPYEFIHWLAAAAEAGIREAQYDLARRYYKGNLVPKDHYMAEVWFVKAAEEMHPFAAFYLGYGYRFGKVFRANPEKSETYLKLAERLGDAETFFEMGRRLEFGFGGIPPQLEESLRWYVLASDMGSDKAYFSVRRVYNQLKTGQLDTLSERREDLFKLPSVEEEVKREALLREADHLMDQGDYEAAVEKYTMSADMGNADAMYMMAILYHSGEIIRRNDQKAFSYLSRASIAGCADASLELGHMLEFGDGHIKDLKEALNCYARATAQGNLSAYYDLSRHMEHPERFVRETQTVVR